ncbi:holo-ACP synthase [Periweissella fabaria]|uniref:Holo-[acyl-carrier-protein] synthase n=1 Tax=Periweissella fabaria TaxID=546157 RepID=A0ABM8Z5T1_9LACO|nr:holo-ACP synthase [Periweissella fabaria]MCM0597554.1 holo-ACP synthase [Periweissella fabaria]CAH0416737.1 Holo-[acyl-carrier-protein] synthase [Periweissella fabaria]
MIYGLGIDLADIDRVWDLTVRKPEFMAKFLTPREQSELTKFKGMHAAEFVAGRWSAKEAYSKAFGTGIGRELSFLDLEIINNEVGQPVFTKHPFTGRAHVSITHTDKLVMTEVILEQV